MPLLARGELVGVLCIESETPYRFHEDDKATIELLGSYLALAIQNAQLQERRRSRRQRPRAEPAAGEGRRRPLASTGARSRREVASYYQADDCVLVDGEYLIRGLPARILWKLLSMHGREGRGEFTNRELRLDKSLNLPEYKDNLETRLLLLRRRLDEKCPDIRLVPRARGRFALELGCDLSLVERP